MKARSSNRIIWIVALTLLGATAVFLLSRQPRNKIVDLEAGLQRTIKGEFNLIALGPDLISFQKGPYQKYQYYFTPPLSDGTRLRIRAAAAEAGSKGFPVSIMGDNE